MSEKKPCPYSDGLIICPKESVPIVKEFIHAMTSNTIEDALLQRATSAEALLIDTENKAAEYKSWAAKAVKEADELRAKIAELEAENNALAFSLKQMTDHADELLSCKKDYQQPTAYAPAKVTATDSTGV
jgi:uncharacterized coiled-coil DUF342 family protein